MVPAHSFQRIFYVLKWQTLWRIPKATQIKKERHNDICKPDEHQVLQTVPILYTKLFPTHVLDMIEELHGRIY
jgi:hypothetical protein